MLLPSVVALGAACDGGHDQDAPLARPSRTAAYVSSDTRDAGSPTGKEPQPPSSKVERAAPSTGKGPEPDVSLPRPRRVEASGCYAEMARIGGFCIDRWEAYLVAADDAGRPWRHPHNERPARGVLYEARSAPGAFPQGYVNRDEAGAACQVADKRLCTFQEWREACQGKTGRRFPYGRSFEASRCNVGKEHLLRKLYGDDPSQWSYVAHFNNPALGAQAGFLARAGEHDRCVTPEGVYDLSGNLEEWVTDRATYPFVRRLLRDYVEREDQPMKVGNGVFVGGFFSTLHEHGPGCLYTTVAHEATYHDYSTGFRCCANPREATPPTGPRGEPPAP